MPPKVRLDSLLVARGLAPSRERARALILAGRVQVGGSTPSKAGALVSSDAPVVMTGPDHPYVGRGGVKLAHALETFRIDVTDCRALDVGASTGGFTDVLLRRGAARVVALDVGRGQLDWRLRTDPRVVVIEGVNARTLTADRLPSGLVPFDIITVDLSFISLRLVLPALRPLVSAGGHLVALVKPQFEAGRRDVGRGGIVRDPAVHARVLDDVAAAADRIGWSRVAVEPSPIEGAEGNREFFVQWRPA